MVKTPMLERMIQSDTHVMLWTGVFYSPEEEARVLAVDVLANHPAEVWLPNKRVWMAYIYDLFYNTWWTEVMFTVTKVFARRRRDTSRKRN